VPDLDLYRHLAIGLAEADDLVSAAHSGAVLRRSMLEQFFETTLRNR